MKRRLDFIIVGACVALVLCAYALFSIASDTGQEEGRGEGLGPSEADGAEYPLPAACVPNRSGDTTAPGGTSANESHGEAQLESDDEVEPNDELAERKQRAEEMRRHYPPWTLSIAKSREIRAVANSGAIGQAQNANVWLGDDSGVAASLIANVTPPSGLDGVPPGGRIRQPRREVWGRVLEVQGAELIPLSGVMVYDYDEVRTFTDDEGRFRFWAYCAESGRDSDTLDNDVSNDECHLTAWAAGYVEAISPPTWFAADELNSPEGVRLYLRRVENAPIRLRLTNPPTNVTDITLWAGGFGTGASTFNYDVNYYVSGKADANGELLISVPPLTFGSFGAYGRGWRCHNASWNDLGWYDGVRTVEITLKPAENKLVRGVVYDLRSGAVLPGVKVCTYSDQSEVTFTDDRGAFELWVDPVTDVNNGGNALVFSHPGYRGIAWALDRLETPAGDIVAGDRPTNGFEGVWTVSLRPFVAVTGRVMRTDSSPVNGGKLDIGLEAWPPGFVIGRDAIQVGDDGTFECPWFPWGLRNVRYAARQSPIYMDADIDAAVWNGEEPFELIVSLP